MKRKIFVELLKLATQGMFIYKNKIFHSINGAATSSPFVQTKANFFLSKLETLFLQQTLNQGPILRGEWGTCPSNI